MTVPLAVGDYYPVWWETCTTPPNMARVLAFNHYKGKYTQDFDTVLHLEAPTTKAGHEVMAVNLKSGPLHGTILKSLVKGA